ncbi:DEAD/DEAH box helicase [Cohnella faecalis]|uniref:DEAD/DEAH box helicase n=1 Tax=Cohnella faecalis TaxID=2315694 RepID=A0A398CKL5_9BACL|nr:DEAD/DEAH box helicase [Cohnella faecalis]RIE02840.1 DEAD/DEAH box helicase [Cohnella faecalis]
MSSLTNTFEELGLNAKLTEKLASAGIKEPSAVQCATVPSMLEGRDGVIVSPTGTGKTLAYLLPILHRIDPALRETQALVLAPTQELAMQIVREAEAYGGPLGIKAVGLIGGASLARQLERMKGRPALVVGTPGRVKDVASSRKLNLNTIRTVVVDETDRIYSLGGRSELEHILRGCSRDRQTVFVSATRSASMKEAESRWLNNAWLAEGHASESAANGLPETIEHWYFLGDRRDKVDLVRKLLRHLKLKPILLFLNDTDRIGELLSKLKYEGISASALYGDVSGRERGEALRRFRVGQTKILIATDVAARGLDVPGLPVVIQFEPALDADHYVHRAGRTGRMGKKGISITFISTQERFIVDKLGKQLGIEFQPKALYEGRVVAPEQATKIRPPRAEQAGSEPSGKPERSDSAGQSRKPDAAGIDALSARSPKTARIAHTDKPAKSAKPAQTAKPAKAAKSERHRDSKNKGAPRWLKEKRSTGTQEGPGNENK